jgi:pyruvate dehydrogenase E2 component (dihydrolipoyllysine-residue acetyltransferase)
VSDFRMPSLGADMREGTLVAWKVKPGDRVKRGQIIAEVATDKGDIEIEVFDDGVVTEILVEPDHVVPVGEVLARIATDAGSAPVATPAPPPSERARATPIARRLALERGVDLATVRGTGPGGAITREDVEKASSGRPESKEAPPAVVATHGIRQAIAAAMAKSNREIPHYYLETHIDMKRTLDFLAGRNETLPLEERLLPVVALLKAVALGLRDVPELNGYWIDEELKRQDGIHIGFAVSLRTGGLVLPAIHDVDGKSLVELMASLRELVTRARAGRLRSSELTDGTVTVTNLGDLGVETVYGVIYPPQVALVGFGKILERPWADNGMLGVRPILSATLAGDHRATDGRRGAQFLEALARHLQEPERL